MVQFRGRSLQWRCDAVAILAIVAATLLPVARSDAADVAPPNIVYILADDLGWKECRLSRSTSRRPASMRWRVMRPLEQFYAEPMCTPTRAALDDRSFPMRYGLQTAVIPSAGTYGLATDEWLLPQALKEAGYETAIVGKWHLGMPSASTGHGKRGFDHQYGPLLGEIDYLRKPRTASEIGFATTSLSGEGLCHDHAR